MHKSNDNNTLVSHLVNQAHKLSYEDQLKRLNKFHSERLAQNLLKISKRIEKNNNNSTTAENSSSINTQSNNNSEMQGLRSQVGAKQTTRTETNSIDDWRVSLQREIDAQVRERLNQEERRKREQYAMLHGPESGDAASLKQSSNLAKYKYRPRKIYLKIRFFNIITIGSPLMLHLLIMHLI